jgi:Domain of unknown function (DUF4440)
MTSKTVEQELLTLENQFWQAIKDKNADAVARLSDDPCLITGAQGVSLVDRQAMMGLTKAAPYTLHDFRISDSQVRLLHNEVAVLVYHVHEELTVEGKPVTIDAADADSSRWPLGVCAPYGVSEGRSLRPRPGARCKLVRLDACRGLGHAVDCISQSVAQPAGPCAVDCEPSGDCRAQRDEHSGTSRSTAA